MVTMNTESMDTISAVGAKTAVAAGATTTAWAWLTQETLFGFVGATVAVLGLLITAYVNWLTQRRHARERARPCRSSAPRVSQ